MTLSERELGLAKAFGADRRRRERWYAVALFIVSLMTGLFGAYLGVHAVLSLFAAVAIVLAGNWAVWWLRRTFFKVS